MSKLLKKIQLAVELGGNDLKQFAKVAGLSVSDFKKAFEKDAVKALSMFISGLNNTKRNGKSAIAILQNMDLTEVRLSNTILSLANASNVMNNAVDLGNKAWEDNTALANEANKRYGTLKSQITMAINKIKDLAITFGNKLMPTISKVIKSIEKLTEWVSNLSDEEVEFILKTGAVITVTGPLLTILGKITSTVGGTIKGIGTLTQAIGVMKGTVTTTSTAVNGLANVISPTTMAITAIVAVISGFKIAMNKATEETRKYAEECENSLQKTLEEKEAIEKLNSTIDENTQKRLVEIENAQDLWKELKNITDENGKIKDGYETRAKVITERLSKALGIEISTTGNVINKYKELQNEIDNLILKKKGEAILQGNEEKYNNAIAERTQKTQELIDKQEELRKAKEKERELEKKYNQEDREWQWGWEAQKNYKDLTKQKDAVHALEKEIDSLQGTIGQYTENIEDYEYSLELYTEGTRESLNKIINETGKTYQKNGETLKTTFEQQIKEQQIYNNNAKKLYNEAEKKHSEAEKKKSNYTINESQRRLNSIVEELISQTSVIGDNSEDIINAWKTLANDSYSTYYDTIKNMPPELAKKIQQMTGVTAEKTPEIVEETKKMTNGIIEQIEKNSEFKKVAIDNLQSLLNGLQDEQLRELLKEAGIQDIDKVMQGIRQGNLGEEQGKDILSKLYNGLNNKSFQNNIFDTARGIASKLSNLLNVKVTAEGASLAFKAVTGKLPRT